MTTPSRPSPTPFSAAVRHPLNLTLLAALGASALMTGSWWPALIGAVTELVWLVIGPRLDETKRYVRWQRIEANRRAQIADEQALLRQLSEADRRRFLELDQIRRDIRRLVEGHQSLSTDMLKDELEQVDGLVSAYLKAVVTATMQERVVAQTDLPALEDEKARLVEAGGGEDLDIVEARLAETRQLAASIEDSRSQLARVGAQLSLVRDRVAGMTRPEDLAEPLDALVQTVAVVEAAGRETEQIGRRILSSSSIGH